MRNRIVLTLVALIVGLVACAPQAEPPDSASLPSTPGSREEPEPPTETLQPPANCPVYEDTAVERQSLLVDGNMWEVVDGSTWEVRDGRLLGSGDRTTYLLDGNIGGAPFSNGAGPLVFRHLEVVFTGTLQPGTELQVLHRAAATLRLDADRKLQAGLADGLVDTGLRGTEFAVRFTNVGDRVRLDIVPLRRTAPPLPIRNGLVELTDASIGDTEFGTDAWTIAVDATGSESHGFEIPQWHRNAWANARAASTGPAANFGFDILSGEVVIEGFYVTKACHLGLCVL